MNDLQRQLCAKVVLHADAARLAIDKFFDPQSEITPQSVREIARPFQKTLSALTTLECSLRGNEPATGENNEPLPK